MKYLKLNNFGSAVLAMTLLLSGCTKESIIDNGGGTIVTGEDVTVTMTLNIPGASVTRGLTATQEEAVNNIDIFVFDKDLKLTDWQYGNVVNNAGVVSFSTTLTASKNNNDKFRLMVLANVRTTTYGIFQGTNFGGHKGKTYAEIRTLLQGEIPTFANLAVRGIPMWGEVEDLLFLGANATNNYSMDLLRSVARIDVGTNANPTFGSNGQITGWAKLSNFSLEKVYVYNGNTHYALATDRANYDFTDGQVDDYSLPATTTKSGTPTEYSDTQLSGTVTRDSGTGISISGNIYAGEADVKMTASGTYADVNHANRMAIVVAGYYNGSTDLSYYRLDFLEGTNGSTLMDMLRNNCYQIVINDASGAGSTTKEEAFTKFNADLRVVVNRWSDAGQQGTAVNGDWWLKVSPYSFNFDKWAKTEEEIIVTTNAPVTSGKSWSVTVEKFADTDATPTWLTIVSGTESGVSGDVLKFDVAQAPASFTSATDIRKARLRFKAGTSPNDMTFDLIVTQTGDDGNHMLRLSHSEFVFAGRKWDQTLNGGAGGWTNPDPQDLIVNYGPTNQPYYLDLSSYTGGGVTMATAIPTSSLLPNLSISPAAVPDNDSYIADNPFHERSSRLSVTAKNEDGSESITKQVLIRQIYYSLVLSGTKDYYYQDNEYTLTVKSNSAWTPTVSDPGSILTDVSYPSTNGNTSSGESFKFKIKDNATIDGRATVTFSSPDNLFPPRTITIIAQDVLPNSYMVAGGNPVIIPARKAYRVWELDRDLYNDDGRTLPTGNPTAELLWQDEQSLISNVGISGSGRNASIVVTTTNGKQGNAVVALRGSDGEIYWSWHIWVTDYNPDQDYGTANGYTFMDRNLGAFGTSGYDAYGLFYQGGRKDPFPASTASNAAMKTVYDINNNILITYQTGICIASAPPEGGIPVSIQSPKTRLYAAYGTSSWVGSLLENPRLDLWEYDNTYKSDYDPCPADWRTPTYDAYVNFWNDIPMGATNFIWNGMYWPSQGCMWYSSGHLNFSEHTLSFMTWVRLGTTPAMIFIRSIGTGYFSGGTRQSDTANLRCIK